MNQCDNCGSLKARIRCLDCQNRSYCNSSCQSEDWNSGNHKNMCLAKKDKPSPQLIPISPENNIYFEHLNEILDIFIKVRKTGKAEDLLPAFLPFLQEFSLEDIKEPFKQFSLRKLRELWEKDILAGMLISNDLYPLQIERELMLPLERFCAHSLYVERDFINEIIDSCGETIFDRKVFLIFLPISFVHRFYEKYNSLERSKATPEARTVQDEFDVYVTSSVQIVPKNMIIDLLPQQDDDKKSNIIFFFCIVKGNSSNLHVSLDFAKIKVPIEKCHGCLKFNKKTFQCSKCKKSKYCDKICQQKHWPIHKNDCL
jgi:hypothetical protein